MTLSFYVSDVIKAIVVLLVAFVRCQETLEDDTSVTNAVDHKEKRGISLNLGQGLEGYSYLGPSSSYSRGYPANRGYTPITEFGKTVILILISGHGPRLEIHIALIKIKYYRLRWCELRSRIVELCWRIPRRLSRIQSTVRFISIPRLSNLLFSPKTVQHAGEHISIRRYRNSWALRRW